METLYKRMIDRWLYLTLLAIISVGCQIPQVPQPENPSSEPAVKPLEPVQTQPDYGKISPLKLNVALTENELVRMTLPLDEIEFDISLMQQQVNDALGDEKITDPSCEKDINKIYLQSRWLTNQKKWYQAGKVIQSGLDCQPDHVPLNELMAKVTFQTRRYLSCSQICKRLIGLSPGNILAYHYWGMIETKNANNELAAVISQQGLKSPKATVDSPLTPLLQLNLASVLYEMNYYEAAIGEYWKTFRLMDYQRGFSQSDPILKRLTFQYYENLLIIAHLHLELGQIDKSVDTLNYFQKLGLDIDLIQPFVAALIERRIPLFQRFDSLKHFIAYLLSQDNDPEYLLSLFWNASEKLSMSQAYFKSLDEWYSINQQRSLIDIRLYSYGLSLGGEVNEAIEVIEKSLGFYDPDPLLYRDIANYYVQMESWQEALQYYCLYLEMVPYFQYDKVVNEIKQAINSTTQFQVVLDLLDVPAMQPPYLGSYFYGIIAQEAEQDVLAETYFRQSLSSNKKFQPARDRLLELLLIGEKYNNVIQVIHLWSQSQDIEPATEFLKSKDMTQIDLLPPPEDVKDLKLNGYIARACKELGYYDEAEAYYQYILNNSSSEKKVYLSLADVYQLQGRFSIAEKILLDLLSNHSFHIDASSSLEDQAWDSLKREDVFKQLFTLYCYWNIHEGENESVREMTEQQIRKTYLRWVEYVTRELSEPFDWLALQALLEKMHIPGPQGKLTAMLLSEIYASQDQLDEAISVLEPIVPFIQDDEKMLSLVAEMYERKKIFTQGYEFRHKVWQLDPANGSAFLRVVTDLRLAFKANEAVDLVTNNYQKPFLQNKKSIRLLTREAMLNFKITRRYDDAILVLQDWISFLEKEDPVSSSDESEAVSLENQIPLSDEMMLLASYMIWFQTQAQNYAKAIELSLAYYQKFKPDYKYSTYYLMRMLNVRKQYSEIMTLAESLLANEKNDLLVRQQYYEALIEDGQVDRAINLSLEQIMLFPDQLIPKRFHVSLLHQVERFQEARDVIDQWRLDYFDKALEQRYIDTLIALKEYDAAIELLNNSQWIEKLSSVYRELMLKIEFSRDQLQAAIELIDEFVVNKEAPAVFQLKAQVYASFMDYESAMTMLSKAIEQLGESESLMLSYGYYLERAGKVDESISLMEKMLDNKPLDASFSNNLGYILLVNKGPSQRVYDLLKRSYEMKPDSGPTLDSLGWYYYQLGDYELAYEYLCQSAAVLGQVDYEILDHLGDTAYQLGQEELAKKYWQDAMKDLKNKANFGKIDERRNSLILEKIENGMADLAVEVIDNFD